MSLRVNGPVFLTSGDDGDLRNHCTEIVTLDMLLAGGGLFRLILIIRREARTKRVRRLQRAVHALNFYRNQLPHLPSVCTQAVELHLRGER